jgi:hypothetical protein
MAKVRWKPNKPLSVLAKSQELGDLLERLAKPVYDAAMQDPSSTGRRSACGASSQAVPAAASPSRSAPTRSSGPASKRSAAPWGRQSAVQAYDVTYPSTIGDLVRGLRDYLTETGWADVTTQPELPGTKTGRMVTVSDDGGLPRDGVLRRRHRFNVWASSPVDAENLGLAVADYARSRKKMTQVVGPVKVTDETDEVIVVAGASLSHYLVTGALLVRARNL